MSKISTPITFDLSGILGIAEFAPAPRKPKQRTTPDLTRIELAEMKRERKAKRRMK